MTNAIDLMKRDKFIVKCLREGLNRDYELDNEDIVEAVELIFRKGIAQAPTRKAAKLLLVTALVEDEELCDEGCTHFLKVVAGKKWAGVYTQLSKARALAHEVFPVGA